MKSSKPARDAKFDADTRLRSLGEADMDSPLESMGEAIGEIVTGGLVGDAPPLASGRAAAAEPGRDAPQADRGDTRKRPVKRRQGPSAGG